MTSGKKILILGAGGMLGSDLMQVFAGYGPIGWDIDDLDITDEKQVEARITGLRPDCVINAAAYTDVDNCESDREHCYRVNGEAVGFLARVCAQVEAILVHISTDYVFDGENDGGYREHDNRNPLNQYGRSKLRGEEALVEETGHYYLVRTSWLFGRHGKNFVETMLRLAEERDEIEVVNDQRGSPTYTLDLAEQVKTFIEEKYGFGIYHVTNRGNCTWFEFAREIIRLSPHICRITPIDSDRFPRPARRPRCSVLINTRFQNNLRTWQDAVKHYLEVRT